MKTTFTPEYIIENKGCYDLEQVNELSFINMKEIHIKDILESEMPLKDKFWWVIKKCDLTTLQNQHLAILCGEIVLEIYEKKYPNDKAPREAIQAAKDYLDGTIGIDTLMVKRSAAAAADAAANAAYAANVDNAANAYAANAAVNAAYVDNAANAYAAADAAYDAAYVAAYAANAAVYAAAGNAGNAANTESLYQDLLLLNLMIFVNQVLI